MAHIAIAILNYNGLTYLQQYLPSVLAATYANKSVWVIDNHSTDGSVFFLQTHYPQINIVSNAGNWGFARGYNEGLQKIVADYYLLLNSDVEVTPGFIEPILALMEKDETIAFAQPKMRWLRQKELFEYAGAAGGMIDALGYPFCRGRVLEHLEKDDGQYNNDAAIFWASGACLFARASVYWQLQGMYDYFFMQNEEIDLCWRAQNNGYKIYSCGTSIVYHLGGGSLEWNNPKKTFFTFRNNLVMNARNQPLARLLWVLPLRLGLDVAAALRYFFAGKFAIGGAVLKGIMAFWYWLFLEKNNRLVKTKWPQNSGIKNCSGVYTGSIIFNYFIKKKRTFNQLYKR